MRCGSAGSRRAMTDPTSPQAIAARLTPRHREAEYEERHRAWIIETERQLSILAKKWDLGRRVRDVVSRVTT